MPKSWQHWTRAPLSLLLAFLSCAQEGSGGLRALQQYQVSASASDEIDPNTGKPTRNLAFALTAASPRTKSKCGSLVHAMVTFGGTPLAVGLPGGWEGIDLPTNTAPGETVHIESCEQPFINIKFPDTTGEPQNGVLAIDGDGLHFEVPFEQNFGAPEIVLVSSEFGRIVLRLQGFATMPTIDDLRITLWDQLSPSGTAGPIPLDSTDLGADGVLTLVRSVAPTPGRLASTISLTVTLNRGPLPCVGFASCQGSSSVSRGFSL